jgi:glucose-6-phosphate 1-dehydrogenase
MPRRDRTRDGSIVSTSQQHPKATTTEPGRRSPPCALVIFGASGDLTARKLLPALKRLAAYGALPAEVGLIGVARTPMTDEEFSRYCRKAVAGTDNVRWAELVANARYVHGGYDDPATYARLADVVGEIDERRGTGATGPSTSPPHRGCSGRSR